jgi:hypothetical protein
MKSLSEAELRRMASGLHLELNAEELTRLRPMVQDLMDVAETLRRRQSGGPDRIGRGEHRPPKSE